MPTSASHAKAPVAASKTETAPPRIPSSGLPPRVTAGHSMPAGETLVVAGAVEVEAGAVAGVVATVETPPTVVGAALPPSPPPQLAAAGDSSSWLPGIPRSWRH